MNSQNVKIDITATNLTPELEQAFAEINVSKTATGFELNVPDWGLDSLTLASFKKISAKHPESIIHIYDGHSTYLKNGHRVKKDGTVDPTVSRYVVQVSGANKEEMKEIYLRLRVYDFGENFGVSRDDRKSKVITRSDRRRIEKGVFKIDVIYVMYFKTLIVRLLKKYPSSVFTVTTTSKGFVFYGVQSVNTVETTVYTAAA